MPRIVRHALMAAGLALVPASCADMLPAKPEVTLDSKDFWIDRCELKYRGTDFPIAGNVGDVVAVLGPYNRFSDVGNRYFWDDLGLQVATGLEAGTPEDSDAIISVTVQFTFEENLVEQALRQADRPEDRARLAASLGSRPQGVFRGELVIEGALVGQEIDFDSINDSRYEYLKAHAPGALFPRIRQSWAAERYAFERPCADGRRLGFIFSLMPLQRGEPMRLEQLTMGFSEAHP